MRSGQKSVPQKLALFQNYPNPFNPTTRISFTLLQSEFITLEVFNMLGQKIETLMNGKKTAGTHEAIFDAQNRPSGIYFYRIRVGRFSAAKKMILLR